MRRLHSNLLFSPNKFNYFKIRSIFDSFHQQSDNNGRFRLFRPELRNETLTVRISSPSPTFYANFMQIRRSVELSSTSTRKNSSENLRPTATPDDSVGWSPPPMTLRAADRGEGGGATHFESNETREAADIGAFRTRRSKDGAGVR